ncbi:MAG: 2-oxo acid dehydrogenase subunit E2 [Fimbriimonadia bacterium]|jgi:pyruvate dehydrogenase E2 component (dihydrolipoamide acetyltransferase)
MNLTGSFDHRTLDGAVRARFMNVVRDYLQEPYRLLE